MLSLGAPVMAFTQSSDGIVPDDAGARVIFAIIGLAILGLYLLLRRTKRRADDHYMGSRRREQELRDNDPDLRRDDGS